MGEIRHLVLFKFKEGVEGVVVEEFVEAMSKFASELDSVKSFEWGRISVESNETLRQSFTQVFRGISVEGIETLRHGFTHVFMVTFRNAEGIPVYMGHPIHVGIADVILEKIDKVLVVDYPAVVVKPSA